MKKVIEELSEIFAAEFEKCGYDKKYAKISLSNRPDLCEYQCNGAMAAAKQYKKAPLIIAEEIVSGLEKEEIFDSIEAVKPGFINLKLSSRYLENYATKMNQDQDLGVEKKQAEKVIIDYGGANVAKPLHVGHLRSAVIGESLKRIRRFMGDDVTGDVHLGDWGLQIGLIITELKHRNPELVYFDENYTGEYPKEAPFTIKDLEEIYPCANAKSKEDAEFKEEARKAILDLQAGNRGYHAIWQHIIDISVSDLKRNYNNLNVSFELWGKESDAQEYIPRMVQYLKENDYAHISEGALVVDVKEETDTKEVPPCMILKSNGASLYDTTDLATIMERTEKYHPSMIIYVVDKRQELYFERIFRCARKTKLAEKDTKLVFQGFGTMNGKDGKPFKTRDGGVMRLENLIVNVNDAVYQKIMENRQVSEEEAQKTAKIVGLAAIKYGDLSNQASKDYVFDIDRFASFEGNTGPYILYTIVRIKSILEKYKEMKTDVELDDETITLSGTAEEKSLILEIVKFNQVIETVYQELAPHKLCAYIYDLSNAFNRFYHETKILSEEDEKKRSSYIHLLQLTNRILLQSIELLGMEAPERM